MSSDQLHRENEALRERLSRLSEASVRIIESLDFDTALRAVMDSARSLTHAPFASIITLDDLGQVENHLVLGFEPGYLERLWQAPQGQTFFEYLNALPGPLRVGPLEEFTRSIGLEEFRSPVALTAFMAAPILHQGTRSGHIYVGSGEPGREFTQEDEETLVMFASQAALVIANARTHREEQRARADLETLIDTSPVGVVVFDMRRGAAVSFNREGRRIIDGLRNPDQGPEDLLGLMTIRRADGSEFSLQEFPLARILGDTETVRAEEIVMGVPDGRSISVLLNATPIRSDEGELESVVVTMQDMTDVEEQGRLRAEFLAMVSHELRSPLMSVKGSADTLAADSARLAPAEMHQFFRIIQDQTEHMRYLIGDLLDVARIETGALPVDPEPADLRLLVEEAGRGFGARSTRNPLEVELANDLPMVMADRLRIVQVLGNLLSNAAGYSPEGSPITVSAVRDGVHVAVSVTDRGRGIPAELLPELFRKFSRAPGTATALGVDGSGLGLAICRGIVEAHGGRIWAESDGPGLGAKFTFTLPAVERSAVPAPDSATAGSRRTPKVRVLAVDDNPQDLRYVRDVLTRAGYAPIATGDPADVPRLMREEKPHLALLDLVLPGSDGIELMNDIRKAADVPVIFLSMYGQDETVARALDMGAADYLVKPFSPTELAARIRAALRKRLEPFQAEPSVPYAVGGLDIDYALRRVTVDGEPVELTALEYALLYELAVHAPRVLSHAVLLQRVWGPEKVGEPWLVRDVVSRTRRKLGDDADSPRFIITEPRVGYRMGAVSQTKEG